MTPPVLLLGVGLDWAAGTLFSTPTEVHAAELGAFAGFVVTTLLYRGYASHAAAVLVGLLVFALGVPDAGLLCPYPDGACVHGAVQTKPWYFGAGLVGWTVLLSGTTRVVFGPSLVAGVVVTVAAVVLARALVGLAVGEPAHPVTYLGALGGALGALAMLATMRAIGGGSRLPAVQFWDRHLGGEGPTDSFVPGVELHVVYGAAAGGLFPTAARLAGFDGGYFAALPWSLATGVGFGLALFALAIAYLLAGLFEVETPRSLAVLFVLHVVYGLVLGAVVGAWRPFLAGTVRL